MNDRQLEMIKDFYQQSPNYVVSSYFVSRYQVSPRTVQSDIKRIRSHFQADNVATLQSKRATGTKIVINNLTRFKKQYVYHQEKTKVGQAERVRKLCRLLLRRKYSISKIQLENQLFVSSTTLTSDLNKTAQIIAPFQLELKRNAQTGIALVGTERDKRRCLSKVGLFGPDHHDPDSSYRQGIESILVTTLMAHKYHISDTIFQNLVVHIEVSIHRIQQGFALVSASPDLMKYFNSEVEISREIFAELEKRFHIKTSDAEILNLAIYLRGKSDYDNDDYVSSEINSFIVSALTEIKKKFNVDFSQEVDLRISLALHLMPLITRIEYHIQNDNVLLDQIRKSFPIAFDMAAYMGLLLQEKLGQKVAESEISYLAIYFNQYLEKYKELAGAQKVLIVTNLKRSESVLLRQRFTTWFNTEISVLNIVNIVDIQDVPIDDYDVIFTTEQTALMDHLGAILISYFPPENEYSKIKLAIDGFRNKSEILDLFSETRFAYVDLKSKEQVLKYLLEISKDATGDATDGMISAVGQREALGSSYFGGTIALPHPVTPLPIPTFVSVLLLKHPVKWDEDGNAVDLVILVAIEKNNAKIFQLWNYLGRIVHDTSFVKRLKKQPIFSTFTDQFSQLLD